MLPILAAAGAKPIVRYSLIVGGALVLVLSIWSHGYMTGKKVVKQQWDSAIAQASANAMHESVKADAMESAVVKANDQAERVIEAKAEQIKKEVVHHAKQDPKPLSAAVIAMHDRLISLPNEAGGGMSSPDSGAGTPEVPRGGVATETIKGIWSSDGNTSDLTTEELIQAVVDFAEKYALMKNAYKGLSDWNEGRERLELERLSQK